MLSNLFLVVLIACWCRSSVAGLCPAPPGAVAWDPNPWETEIEVMWGYGDNFTCHTVSGCLDLSDGGNDVTAGQNQSLEVQLVPVEMQYGNVLRFTPSHHMGMPFPISPYKVDEVGFRTCNVTGGVQVSELTNGTIDVSTELLEPGSNYFIVDSNLHPLVTCDMGLRVNVTVKESVCHKEHGASCSGWGNCVSYRNQPKFQCHCCGNYKGDNCEVFDPCLSNPCQNGGACVHPGNDTYQHACNCPFGYSGDYCERQTENQCHLVDCGHNGTCVGNTTYFRCVCAPGLTGSHCEVDINECVTSPCEHGLCVDKMDGYDCFCEPGYHGDTCSEQHPACSLSPCKNGGYCQDMTSAGGTRSFRCHCKLGWKGWDCTTKVSACDPNPCSRNGRCEEFNGTFSCRCYSGFTGVKCEVNINDCDPNPCKFGGHCKDGVNAHTCLCIHSHAGSNCQFTLDMFSPILDADGHNPSHTRNLYIVAGCLTALVVVLMTSLVACYCRVCHVCRRCWAGHSRFWYKRHTDDMRVSVDVTSASDCPLAVDAIWKNPTDGEGSTLRNGNSRTYFGNQPV